MRLTEAQRDVFRRMGRKGAKARQKALSPERRVEIAKAARQAQLDAKKALAS